MTLNKGKLVEYERQAGKPPVIASILEVYADGTIEVLPLLVLDDDNSILFSFVGENPHRMDSQLVRPARIVQALAAHHETASSK